MTAITTIENVRANDTFAIADYPCAKWFMPITETSGNDLSELVSGATITFAQAIDEAFAYATYGVTTSGTVGMSNTTATLPDLGITKDLLFIVVADFNADNKTPITIGGGANDPGLRLVRKSGTGTSVMRDTTPTSTTFTGTAIDGSTQAAAIVTDRGNTQASLIETDGTTIAVDGSSPYVLTATAGMDLNEGSTALVFGTGCKVYGYAILTFTGTPSDALAIVSWCNYHWRAGNKVLPPWLKGRT